QLLSRATRLRSLCTAHHPQCGALVRSFCCQPFSLFSSHDPLHRCTFFAQPPCPSLHHPLTLERVSTFASRPRKSCYFERTSSQSCKCPFKFEEVCLSTFTPPPPRPLSFSGQHDRTNR